MDLKIQWGKVLQLRDGSDENLLYLFDYNRLEEKSGIYIFGRRHGGQFEALYVGKAGNLRSRTKGQLKNLPLMFHMRKAKSGKRILLAGYFKAKKGQQQGKCLDILERALIRYFLSEGHDLVNKQGTRLRRHEITSEGGKRAVPKLMFVDRGKGE